MAFGFRGKAKGFFFRLRLDVLVPKKIFSFFAHIGWLSKWISRNKKIGYNDFYSFKFDYKKRYDMYQHIIDTQGLNNEPIDYLEFGVSRGESFKWWVSKINHTDTRFYGFDTFTGLPEDWGPFKAGDMSNGNEPPQIEGNRHEFFQGLFQTTLVPFLSTYEVGKRKVVHMDADLYTATLYTLTLITPYLRPGDIILFDEFNVPLHEFKAFKEWTESFYIDYEVLAAINNYYQVAIMLK